MQEFYCFIVFYVNTFFLLYFLEGGLWPPSHPPKSATVNFTKSLNITGTIVCTSKERHSLQVADSPRILAIDALPAAWAGSATIKLSAHAFTFDEKIVSLVLT